MNRIRTLRKTGSMSQKELADVIGVPQSLVSLLGKRKENSISG